MDESKMDLKVNVLVNASFNALHDSMGLTEETNMKIQEGQRIDR
jgi:hypothetical protein